MLYAVSLNGVSRLGVRAVFCDSFCGTVASLR